MGKIDDARSRSRAAGRQKDPGDSPHEILLHRVQSYVLPPRYAVWEITLACNLACVHCGSRAGRARERELTTEEALRVVDQLAETGVEEVTLVGGESYLREDWDAILRALGERRIRTSIATGGRGLTRERVRRAREAGIETVGVSVDGLEATHDRLRGVRGSWRWAMEAIDLVRAEGVRATSNTQVNRVNRQDLEALCDVLVSRGISGWQVQITAALGRAADRPELLLQPYDVLDLIPRLAALKIRCEIAGVELSPGNNVGYFGPHEEILRRHYGRAFHWEGCGAGRTAIGIESDGTLKGCPSLQTDAYAAGNLRESTLPVLWKSSPVFERQRAFSREDLWGGCRDCYYAETCRGGCAFTAHAILGRPGNQPYCYHRAEELRKRGRREVLVPAKPPPGRPFDSGLFELREESYEPGNGTVSEVPSARLPL